MEMDYRRMLRDELVLRQKKNMMYSLRAFARDLEMPAPKLSQIMNGKCGLSRERACKLAQKLSFSPAETQFFVASVEASHSRSRLARSTAAESLKGLLSKSFSKLNLERFAVIRDWYHMVLLELTAIDGFKPSIPKIARALGVSEDEIRAGVGRLKSIGLLEVDKGAWRQSDVDMETPSDISSRAIRDYHRQVLAKGLESLEKHAVGEREFGSLVLSMDEALVPEMKDLIRRFKKEASALCERSPKKNSVHLLNIQFFPVARKDQL